MTKECDVIVSAMRFCTNLHDVPAGREKCWCGAPVKVDLPSVVQPIIPASEKMCKKHPDLSVIG